MTAQLLALCFDAHDPRRLTQFWAGVLGWEPAADADAADLADTADGDGEPGGTALLPPDDTGFRLRFRPSAEPKTVANQLHFDLTSGSPEDQQRTVARALELGARHIDVGQKPEEGHIVLADPEGNEFCVIEPGNAFLADCGFIGALACDGSQAVGYFWSAALGWPLVWDQDQETAIRSPHGGPKITWGGPPLPPKPAHHRQHFDLAVPAGAGLQEEVERLLALGATRPNLDPDDAGRVVLADPDGHEFCLLAPPQPEPPGPATPLR